MAKVVVSSPANADFEFIVRELAAHAGARVAARYGENFRALFRRFGQFPGSGASRLRLGEKVRVGVVAPYVIVYEYDDANDVVLILRIVHGRRKITRGLIR